MEDRDGKKPFIIPKTHTSNKDVVINEKPDSRNVIELFNDIKSCALEGHFDFRQNGCKSCDTIRNKKLQKLYNEKRVKMKKDQDPIERLAFHLITYRDVAVNVANNGLMSDQLTFSIDKYLGNPKDGVHLSRRPDVLLTSSGSQGLYRFGLLVCKVLLGKGYATIPSINNNQLPAQLHYDHHFCKIQSINKEQRHIDDLLANSLIFCYEHENFETIPHPPQILPIAILWYDLTEKFSPELVPISTQESQHRNGKIINGEKSIKKKTSNQTKNIESLIFNKPIISDTGVWEGPPSHESNTTNDTTESSSLTATKYPTHFMVPFHRVYSTPNAITSSNLESPLQQTINPIQQIIHSRDPRLLRTKRETISTSSETIPLSPQHLLNERSLSDGSIVTKSLKFPSDEPLLITKSTSVIYIPLNSSTSLIDPRLKILKQTRNIFYLELQAVKHALQQQKRLNHYYDPKSGLPPKTSYTLVPFLIRQVLNNEYERLLNDNHNTYKFTKHSNNIDYSSLYISVIDCLNFGFTKSNQTYIDLEQNENKLAYEQIEISNELIQREKQLNSQQIRLRIREKRQKRIQQQINEKKSYDKVNLKPSSLTTSPSLLNSKVYITTGRQLLKDHQISTITSNTHLSSDLLDFFSREYKNENRTHVKHLLAELVGVFIEKYHIEHNQNEQRNHNSIEESVTNDQTINSVIDMDLDSPQELCDHDERFRIPTPPPPLPPPLALPPLPPSSNETIYSLSNEPNTILNDPDYKVRCHKLIEQLREEYQLKQSTNSLLTTKSTSIIPTEEVVFKACFEPSEFSSSSSSPSSPSTSENSPNHDIPLDETISLSLNQDNSNRSRDEFVKLLTKEACISKSSSPVKKQNNNSKHSYDYSKYRRQSHDDDNERKNPSNHSNSHQQYTRSSDNKKHQLKKSPQKKVSSNRTVLISKYSTISNENQQTNDILTNNQNNSQEEPKIKRLKIDSSSPSSPNITDNINEIDQKDTGLKSIVTVPVITDDHDCRHDLNEKRRMIAPPPISNVSIGKNSQTRSSPSRSRSKSKERQRSSTNSRSSSIISSSKSKTYSQSSSSRDKQHRHQQQNLIRDNHKHERNRSSPDLSNRHHKSYSNQLSDRHESSFRDSISSIYHQRDINDLTLLGNFHHQRQPIHHRRFNYNHQSVADHPRFSNPNVLPSSTPLMDFDYSKPPSRHHNISPMSITDRNVKSSYSQHIDQTESLTKIYSNNYDSKPSIAIEKLQMILQNKTSDLFDQSINETIQYSSTNKIDTIISDNNNQTFSYNDAEKLLTMVQRLRN